MKNLQETIFSERILVRANIEERLAKLALRLSPKDIASAVEVTNSPLPSFSLLPFSHFVVLAAAFGCSVADLFAVPNAPQPPAPKFKTCQLRDIIDYYVEQSGLSIRDVAAIVRFPLARFYERVESGLTIGQVVAIASRFSLSLVEFLAPLDPLSRPYRRGFCGVVSPEVADGWVRDNLPLDQLQQVADAFHCEVWELFVSSSFVEAERARRKAALQPVHLLRVCPSCQTMIDLKLVKYFPK